MSIGRMGNVPLPRDVPILIPSPSPAFCEIVTEIATKVFEESAVSLVLGSSVALFVTTQMGLALIISAASVQFAVSVFFHSLQTFASYKALNHDSFEPHYLRMKSFCGWVLSLNFGILTGLNAQTLIHESGHFLAALATYKNPRPIIEIHPFIGGITQFYKTSLSRFGQKLGPSAATCFVVASGPAFTLLISSAILAIGFAISQNYPDFGKYLVSWAFIDFLNHASYAYSALNAEPWNLSHDFVHLSIFGLSPVVATIGILAIPALITLGALLRNTEEPPENAGAAALF